MKITTTVGIGALIGFATLGVGMAMLPGSDVEQRFGHINVQEDDEWEWSCITMGNHVCGPNNAEGKVAGCYNVDGILVELWPCNAKVEW